MSKLEYRIVSGESGNELTEEVQSLIDEGFEPIGGVAIQTVVSKTDASEERWNNWLCQAMVRRAAEPTMTVKQVEESLTVMRY